MKSTRSNALHAVGYSYACKRAAAIERRVSDARHAVRYGYACKRTAAIERRVSDACYTVCNAYTCKRAASVKCTFSNARQVAVYYNVFQTFTIFKCLVTYLQRTVVCFNCHDCKFVTVCKSKCIYFPDTAGYYDFRKIAISKSALCDTNRTLPNRYSRNRCITVDYPSVHISNSIFRFNDTITTAERIVSDAC